MKTKNLIISLVTVLFTIINHQKYCAECAPTAEPELKQVSPNVYRFFNRFDRFLTHISMFVITKRGVIVIEPFNTDHSMKLVKAIRTVTKRKIKYMLVSHNHWDHASGTKVFKDLGATVLAHQEAVEWMKDNPHPDLTIPDKTWRGTKKILRVGGETLELYYKGINHGLGMTIFLYKSPTNPKDNVLYIADLIPPDGGVLFGPVPDFNLKELERTLKEVVQLDFDRVVVSHNAQNIEKRKADIQVVINYIVGLRTGVDDLLQKGTNPFEIPNILRLPGFENLPRFESDLPLNAQKMVFERIIGPYPWRKIDNCYPQHKCKNKRGGFSRKWPQLQGRKRGSVRI